MLKDPALQITWLSKNEESKAFEDAFLANKRTNLFAGLDELYKAWGDLSEKGSHATINAICERFIHVEDDKNIEWRMNYCGVEESSWAKQIFSILLILLKLEQTLFKDYEARLQFDETLLRMRAELERRKLQLRQNLIAKYKIPPPL
ncbi:MAG: hypothetical protein ABJA69_10295 [Acidobacteriaceae bacterium]